MRFILASGLALPVARSVLAQRALVTPRGTGAPPKARSAELPLARDLAEDAKRMQQEHKPMLVFFDRQECPYCEQALREYLVPMAGEGWGERALFRQVEIDRELPLVAFDGAATTHRAFAERHRVTLSPTVLIVGATGERLAEPIVGLMVDFYGAYLEKALEEALSKVR